MKKLRVGVIGLGTFGEIQTAILSELPNVQLEALSSRTKSRVESIGRKYKVEKLCTNYKDLLADPGIEAVFIVSDARVHAVQALDAIHAGKDVFLEKPPALTYQDAVRVVESARRAGVFLMVGYLLRFEIRHAMLKKYMEDGRFGHLVHMSFKRSASRFWTEGNSRYSHPVYESMTHDIDLALWYAKSRVKTVYAKQMSVLGHKVPDACLAIITFKNGVIASLEINWLIPDAAPLTLVRKYEGTLDSYFEAVGTTMTSRIKLMHSGFTLWTDKKVIHPETVLWPEVNGSIEGALGNEISHFANCILTGERSSIASVDDALHGMRVADGIIESASNRREIKLDE
jgi:UDP-N-acetylglucosamine 3-dehydrogenase